MGLRSGRGIQEISQSAIDQHELQGCPARLTEPAAAEGRVLCPSAQLRRGEMNHFQQERLGRLPEPGAPPSRVSENLRPTAPKELTQDRLPTLPGATAGFGGCSSQSRVLGGEQTSYASCWKNMGLKGNLLERKESELKQTLLFPVHI